MSATHSLSRRNLISLYQRLDKAYGHLHWWPADARFEILIGAVLTQNTAWANVERALVNLRLKGWLDARRILSAPQKKLAEALRPSGYFNLKTIRLRNLCEWFTESGGFRALDLLDTAQLREKLLAVNGIGPETADDILLYAFDRPVFVVDAYTRRILSRLSLMKDEPDYESLRARIEKALPADVPLFKQYHALIVEHAKRVCRPRPLCHDCVLARRCDWSRGAID